MSKPHLTAKKICQGILALKESDARRAYLAEACGENAELRQEVIKLLRAGPAAEEASPPPIEATRDFTPGLAPSAEEAPAVAVEKPGTRVGPYKLIQQIGEGGMGAVYMAEQQQPVRRLVALKVIKAGMDSAQVIARFEAERQALALMDHPNIAKVLDAGTTELGRSYFVMELVKGIPITRYCDEQRQGMRQRLELFVPVCQAVQHAHQKGIIHRDLKPSNVLVASYDGKPVPKIIDFGVAKAAGQQLTERTLVTGFGSIVGTLEYMSPEQAEFNALDIDTRSDVYSLGVLLYELLTGTTPLSHGRLKTAALTDALRLIREEEPPRPSTRLSEAKDTLASVSAQRRMEAPELIKALRGEVDWIVMKALDKDRSRRYETANGLARDIQRYLADEAVDACPPSAGYRLRKLARKYRRGLLTVAVLLALLLVGTVVSTTLAIWALNERAHAVQAEEEAKRSEAETKALLNFVTDFGLSEVTTQEALVKMASRSAKAIGMIEQHLKSFEGKAGADSTQMLHYRSNLAYLYLAAGLPTHASRMLQQDLKVCQAKFGPDNAETLTTTEMLARAYREAGQFDEARPLSRAAFDVRIKKLPAENPARDWQQLKERAILYGRGGQWARAAADFTTLLQVHPGNPTSSDDHFLWYQAAPLLLQVDRDRYRRHCQDMLQRFGATTDPAIAERTAKACLLTPDLGGDIAPYQRLAKLGLTGTEKHSFHLYFIFADGLVRYRSGAFEDALNCLKPCLDSKYDWRLRMPASLIAAMAHQRLGHADQARQALRSARSLMTSRLCPRIESGDLGQGEWFDWLICQHLLKEAEALVGGAPGDQHPQEKATP